MSSTQFSISEKQREPSLNLLKICRNAISERRRPLTISNILLPRDLWNFFCISFVLLSFNITGPFRFVKAQDPGKSKKWLTGEAKKRIMDSKFGKEGLA